MILSLLNVDNWIKENQVFKNLVSKVEDSKVLDKVVTLDKFPESQLYVESFNVNGNSFVVMFSPNPRRMSIVDVPSDVNLITNFSILPTNELSKKAAIKSVVDFEELFKDLPAFNITYNDLRFISIYLNNLSSMKSFAGDLLKMKNIFRKTTGTLHVEMPKSSINAVNLVYNPEFVLKCIIEDSFYAACNFYDPFSQKQVSNYTGAITTISYLIGHELLHFRFNHFDPVVSTTLKKSTATGDFPPPVKNLKKFERYQSQYKTILEEMMNNQMMSSLLKVPTSDSGIEESTGFIHALNIEQENRKLLQNGTLIELISKSSDYRSLGLPTPYKKSFWSRTDSNSKQIKSTQAPKELRKINSIISIPIMGVFPTYQEIISLVDMAKIATNDEQFTVSKPKFKVGDLVKDKKTNKIYKITEVSIPNLQSFRNALNDFVMDDFRDFYDGYTDTFDISSLVKQFLVITINGVEENKTESFHNVKKYYHVTESSNEAVELDVDNIEIYQQEEKDNKDNDNNDDESEKDGGNDSSGDDSTDKESGENPNNDSKDSDSSDSEEGSGSEQDNSESGDDQEIPDLLKDNNVLGSDLSEVEDDEETKNSTASEIHQDGSKLENMKTDLSTMKNDIAEKRDLSLFENPSIARFKQVEVVLNKWVNKLKGTISNAENTEYVSDAPSRRIQGLFGREVDTDSKDKSKERSLVFLLDLSGSMDQNLIVQICAYLFNILSRSKIIKKAVFMDFDGRAVPTLISDKKSLNTAMKKILTISTSSEVRDGLLKLENLIIDSKIEISGMVIISDFEINSQFFPKNPQVTQLLLKVPKLGFCLGANFKIPETFIKADWVGKNVSYIHANFNKNKNEVKFIPKLP